MGFHFRLMNHYFVEGVISTLTLAICPSNLNGRRPN